MRCRDGSGLSIGDESVGAAAVVVQVVAVGDFLEVDGVGFDVTKSPLGHLESGEERNVAADHLKRVKPECSDRADQIYFWQLVNVSSQPGLCS